MAAGAALRYQLEVRLAAGAPAGLPCHSLGGRLLKRTGHSDWQLSEVAD